jgi:hypothetical protein
MNVAPADVTLVQKHPTMEAGDMATIKGTILGAATADRAGGGATADVNGACHDVLVQTLGRVKRGAGFARLSLLLLRSLIMLKDAHNSRKAMLSCQACGVAGQCTVALVLSDGDGI